MRPVVWFLLVIGVPQVGVALTLAHPLLDSPEMAPLVFVAGFGWAILAWRAGRHRAAAVLPVEGWWVKRFYLLPLAVCLVGALAHDPPAAAGFRRLVGSAGPDDRPPARPPGSRPRVRCGTGRPPPRSSACSGPSGSDSSGSPWNS